MSEKKLWGGRFRQDTDALVEEINASIRYDQRLARHDILGSIAHATMLASCGHLTEEERDAIIEGLIAILAEVEKDQFTWREDREDVHMNIEGALKERIGDTAGKLHTARSRNDQVALDLRLWLRDTIHDTLDACMTLQETLILFAEKSQDILMPGYTHLQRAQPVSAAHHLLAYVEMLERDNGRLLDALTRTNILPLGSGALAATPHSIDREQVAALLRFDGITQNSMDAVSDRDFVIEFLGAAAICQMHLSRLSEEFILWSSQEFAFISLPDAFCTGSSIMPQKKNPDIPELIRGKTGRINGALVSLLTIMKGLPLAYNKDMQEDKEPLFDAADTLLASLTVTARMLEVSTLHPESMRKALDSGFLTATDLADALVEDGLPFREAHRIVGEVVAHCLDEGIELHDLSAETLSELTGGDGPTLILSLDPVNSVARRDIPGGPAPNRVADAIKTAQTRLGKGRQDLANHRAALSLDHLLGE